MVVLTDEELEAADPERSRTIEIESFVPVAQIDPVHFDHVCYLVPRDKSKGTLRSYDLLTTAMRDSELAAVSRFVMRTREYLAAIRGVGGVLALSTMYFPAEVRPTAAAWSAPSSVVSIDASADMRLYCPLPPIPAVPHRLRPA
jgi:DNA end-binding protein Ku